MAPSKKTKKEEKKEEKPIVPITLPEPRLFTMVRGKDETGISGTGRVLDGIIFHTGKVAVCWRSDDPNSTSPARPSINIYDSLKDFMDTHINYHNNDASLVFYDTKIAKKKAEETKK